MTAALSPYSAVMRPLLLDSAARLLAGTGLPGVGSVAASPSMITAPSRADSTITACAEGTLGTALSPANRASQSATALSPGPNRNPSSETALNHAKRLARCFSCVYPATSADTTGITAATKNPVAKRSA